MRRIGLYIAASVFFFPFCVNAQQLSAEKKLMLVQKVDSLISNYIDYHSLHYPGSISPYSEDYIQSFRKLFVPEALVFDEITPAFLENNYETPYFLSNKNLFVYVEGLKKNFPDGITSKVLNLNVNYSGIDSKEVKVFMEKEITAFSSNGFMLYNKDTILLTLKFSPDYASIQIGKIEKVKSNLIVQNDMDKDFVPDNKDKCPQISGSIECKGCPCAEGSSAFAGIVTGINSVQSDFKAPKKFGYDNGEISPLSVSKKSGNSVSVGLEGGVYLGRKRKIGIGSGLSMTFISYRTEIENFIAKYKRKDKNENTFKQIINSNKFEEKDAVTVLKIPLMLYLNFGQSSSKTGFFANGGIFYSFIQNASVKSSPKFNYEARYSFNSSTGALEYSKQDAVTDWVIEDNFVKSLSGANSDAYFSKLNGLGYNLGLDKNTAAKKDIPLKGSLGFTAQFGICRKISKSSSVNFGVNAEYLMAKNENDKSINNYTVTNTVGEYNSLLASVSKINFFSAGIFASFKFGF